MCILLAQRQAASARKNLDPVSVTRTLVKHLLFGCKQQNMVTSVRVQHQCDKVDRASIFQAQPQGPKPYMVLPLSCSRTRASRDPVERS